MLRFQYTEYLLVLAIVPVLLLLYFYVQNWKEKTAARIGDPLLVKELLKNYSPGKFTTKFLLIAVAFVLCSFALANLRKPSGGQKISRNGIDVMIALDVSRSMLAEDVKPSRLERAKQLLNKLVDKMDNDRVGIVVFAGKAYIQMPLTADHSAAKMYINSCGPEMVQTQGTLIGDALERSADCFSTHEKKYKAIILISDGEDHDEGAGDIASKLAADGVSINTVGIGSPDGSPIMDKITNEYKKDKDGNLVVSKLNEQALKDIAQKGKGIYQLFTNTDEVATRLDAQFRSMDQREVTDDSLTSYNSFFQWFLLAALLLLVAEVFISEKRKKPRNPEPVKKVLLSLTALLFLSQFAVAQNDNSLIKKGNEAYNQKDFATAGDAYKKVIEKNPSNATAQYNLGNALYKSRKTDDALKAYDQAIASAKTPSEKAQAFYNKGVALQNTKKLPECIDAYKQSLRLKPDDQDARLNLQKALMQQKQEQQKDQQKKQKPKEDEKKKDEDKKQDQKKKDEEQPKPQPPKMKEKDAEEKLKALMQQEKNLQDKLRKSSPASPNQPEKDW